MQGASQGVTAAASRPRFSSSDGEGSEDDLTSNGEIASSDLGKISGKIWVKHLGKCLGKFLGQVWGKFLGQFWGTPFNSVDGECFEDDLTSIMAK